MLILTYINNKKRDRHEAKNATGLSLHLPTPRTLEKNNLELDNLEPHPTLAIKIGQTNNELIKEIRIPYMF